MDRRALLKKLDRIRYEKKRDEEEDRLQQMNLAGSLLKLADINHENIYLLARQLAEHLLGEVPEPDDADAFEDGRE
jgi:hypothetical protein